MLNSGLQVKMAAILTSRPKLQQLLIISLPLGYLAGQLARPPGSTVVSNGF